jgi:hypothetical protein
MGDSVLERNLCFVDTPGYGYKTSVSSLTRSVMPFLTSSVLGMHYSGC